jgi:hypothetical protein
MATGKTVNAKPIPTAINPSATVLGLMLGTYADYRST